MPADILIRVTAAIEAYNLGNLPPYHAAQVLKEVRDHLIAGADRRIGSALSTMSHTEEAGLRALAGALTDEGGVIVVTTIALRAGVVPSSINNALRKLASAGLIRVQSLGMKGTHVKVLVPGLTGRLRDPRATRPAI